MPDRYTKVVLTIIAGALVALVAQNSITIARAVGYTDACGTITHPACEVTWSRPLPVEISK